MLETKLPIEHLCEKLHCSRPFVYKLVNKGLVTPLYFKGDFSKAFFDLEEVYSALEPMPNGGVKRRAYNKQNHE